MSEDTLVIPTEIKPSETKAQTQANAPIELKAEDVKSAPIEATSEIKIAEAEITGQKITTQMAEEARQKLQTQYRNDAEGVKPMTTAAAPNEADAMQQEMIDAAKQQLNQQIAAHATERQKLTGEMKPPSNVFAPVLVGTGLVAGTAAVISKMGDAAGAAKDFVIETAKEVALKNDFNVIAKVDETFKDVKGVKTITFKNLVNNSITPDNASLVDKAGVVAELNKLGEKVAAKSVDIANQVMGGNEDKIAEAVEGAFKEGGGFMKKSTIPTTSLTMADTAKGAVAEIAEKRDTLLNNGEHVERLTEAFKEKMNGFAVGAVDKFNSTLPNVDPRIKLTALLVGTGLAVAAGHHLATAGERDKTAEQEKEIGKHTQAILAGQQKVAELSAMGGR